MDNIILIKKTPELVELAKSLGFTETLFLDDVTVIEAKTKGELLKKIQKAKNFTIFKPATEDLLRFALEKTKVNLVYGMELINPKDSVHYVRGGLDQITCKIAVQKGKIIGFSFSEIFNSKKQPKLLARMKFNLKLCKKYKVQIFFGNFSTKKEEVRSKKDLTALLRVLKNDNKKLYSLPKD